MFDFYEKVDNRVNNILSTGGEIERSYKKRTGDIFNIDWEKRDPRNKILDEILNKINKLYLERK